MSRSKAKEVKTSRGSAAAPHAGHGRKKWRPYAEAKAYVQALGLTSRNKWQDWAKSGERPSDIPSTPFRIYRDMWEGWPEFLGHRRKQGLRYQWKTYAEVKAYARSLGLRNVNEWREWAKSEARPRDIPSTPFRIYRDKWEGWIEFLGIPRKHSTKIAWRSYAEAKAYVRSLGLTCTNEWTAWRKSGARPSDIPTHPNEVYRDEWEGFGEFLGTRCRRPGRNVTWRPYREAKAYAKTLGVKSSHEWRARSGRGLLPRDIPITPYKVYRDEWEGWVEFLGKGNESARPSYAEVKAMARAQGIKSQKEWKLWVKSGRCPRGIPRIPYLTFGAEWEGWETFLGTGGDGGNS